MAHRTHYKPLQGLVTINKWVRRVLLAPSLPTLFTGIAPLGRSFSFGGGNTRSDSHLGERHTERHRIIIKRAPKVLNQR